MRLVVALLAGGCRPDDVPAGPRPPEPPTPDDFVIHGPGGPSRTFDATELFAACGHILGGPGDREHHNLAVMHDGYLVHPWAPEEGGGGISFFAFDDPCAPELVGQAWSDRMRETHTLAFGEANGREYLAVDMLDPDQPDVGGVGFFDITDRAAPTWVSELATPGFYYPDSYLRVTFSSFWQGPVVYVSAAFNGVHIVDATDPEHPVLVGTWTYETPHLVGSFTVIGNLAMAASAGTPKVVLLDVSDPYDPQPIAGGEFFTSDATGDIDKHYFSSIGGRYGLFTRNDVGGGPMLYDLTDPTAPTFVGELVTVDGDGAYVYRQGDVLFQGNSEDGLIMDMSDPTAPFELARVDIPGDLDTVSPIGNVAVVSVDEGGLPGEATAVFPWREAPDDDPPAVELANPFPGTLDAATTSRIGVSFDEWVERASVHPGSFRVTDGDGWPIAGTFNVQENIVNFTPAEPLPALTIVDVQVPAGGVTDVSGNPVATNFGWRFRTR